MKLPVLYGAVSLLIGLSSALPMGREFATAFMQNLNGDSDGRFTIEVSAALSAQGSTKVKVSAVGQVFEKDVDPGKGVSFRLPVSVEMQGSGRFDKTVVVEASQDVNVLSFNYKQDTADTSVVYPLQEWGTEYYIFTPPSYYWGTYKEFSITNHKEHNLAEVRLRAGVVFQGNYYPAGSKISITLKPFESVQIQSEADLSGTKVVSKLPVAVSSGHSCAQKYTTCNHVYEQLLPTRSWGKEFIIAPLPFHDSPNKHDSVYLQAFQSTKVSMNIAGNVQGFSLYAGQTIELFSQWPNSIYLTSNKGIQVLFEFNGGPTDVKQYFDPFLMSILPTSHFSKSYSLEGQQDFTNSVILVAKNDDLKDVQIDKIPIAANTEWHKADGSDYSWAELNYGTGASFKQIAHPRSPIGVYSFGVAFANGYGSPASGNDADCKTIKCEKDERCEMKGTTPTCVKLPPVVKEGTCWAMGDPHYRTFDGYYFNFMGNCTYTMAKNCHIDTSHPAFEVDAQNVNRGSKITIVGGVNIKVYNYTITILRSEFGLIRMYGTLWNLPITMDNGKVKLSQSGMSVLVETDFGLVVQYDWEQYLTISVSGDFAGKVCGLCGNFNGKHDDDLFTPSGELAGSVQALGKSWRIPAMAEDAYCRDQCVGQCTNCKSDSLMESVTDRLFCGFLSQVMEGPFSACSAIIAPKVYHDNCMYDVCMGEGKWNFFCNTLQVYSDACQRAGIKIHDWRHIAHCPHPACPENSHYEFCGIACPATCETPDAPSKCKASCVETCVCDDGFLLSGTKCVPKTECGCTYMGHYVVAGASIWVDDQCMQNCFCNGAKRQMECKKTGCQAGYECKVVEGLIGCHPMTYATCRASGDPHYRSFDGHVYTFQGTCVYQMAGVCSKTATLPGSPVLEPFDVLVQNNGHNKRAGSSTKLVEVKVYENSIVLSKDHIRSVLINSELTNLPVTLNQGNVTVKLISNFAEIETAFGLTVYYDWKTAVLVKIPSSYAGAMCGLCGNYNQDSKDDLVMKNGKQAASAEEMGKSWRVAETPGCVDGCNDTNHCPDCDFTQIGKFESNAFCGLIRDPKGPFRKCHAVVPPGDDFKNCVDDVCNNNGNLHSFCDSLHLYTIACQQAGVEVDQWRNGNFCPKSDFKHPNNSHYEHCASVCHVTCGISSSTGCKKPCQEGWVCNDGYALSGDVCVPIEQCGCTQKGKYYKHGQIFYPHGQCKEECICNGTVQCYEFSCGPHEKCEVKNGIRLCQPVGKGVCSISGDPHYNTFDKGTYDFQGTCTYTAAEACHLSGTRLPAFSVAVENEKWYAMTSDPKVSVAKLLSVTVYGNTLILRKNQIGMIMLNGIMTTIPLNINDNQVQVYQEGTYYVILTDFGLRVTYDMVYHITVTVPGNYRGHTCGLCGNFNDNKADEFQLPDGKETKDVLSFGAAWKVAVPGVVCEDGCSGDNCPKCDASKKEVFEKDCQVLTNPHGPFAVCHNVIDPASYYRDCVYDVCMAGGDRAVLCHSIGAYMMDCQTFGVTIPSWRTPNFCPLSCSANSHYQICAETCGTPCPGLVDIISCPTSCAEGCACDDGLYFNGTGCVRLDKCACFDNGRTYKIGQSVLMDDCQQLCTCTLAGHFHCMDTKCGIAESCEIQNGLQGCFPKQCVQTGGSFTLFNGVTGAVKPTMAAYTLVEYCNSSASEEWFRVVAKLQTCSLTASQSVSTVYVFCSDMMVAITDKLETWVNGRKVTLPAQPRKDLSVDVSGNSIHVEKKAAFRLSYSGSLGVTVTVSNGVAGIVCGACGPLSAGGILEVSEETMQEYLAPFIAPDFPTCDL